MESQVLHTVCDVIFLLRLQGKFEVDPSLGVKGLKIYYLYIFVPFGVQVWQ